MSGLRQVKNLGIASSENDLPVLKALEDMPRKITAPELIETEEDAA